VPLTRGHGDHAALQFEAELKDLDQLEQFRNHGVGSSAETGDWMRAFSEIPTRPSCVEILRFRALSRPRVRSLRTHIGDTHRCSVAMKNSSVSKDDSAVLE
jgi:hypothetical protein